MKLIQLEVEDFKSIKNIKWKIEDGLTCFVGQNESGKSNLIEILNLIDLNVIRGLSYEAFTNRASERYIKTNSPLIKATYDVDYKDRRYLIEKFNPYCQNKELIHLLNSVTHFIAQSEKDDSLGEFYFKTKDKEYPLTDFTTNPNHQTIIIKLIKESLTKIIKLEDGFVNDFELTIQQIQGKIPSSPLVKLIKLTGVENLMQMPTEPRLLSRYLKRISNSINNKFTKKYYSQDDSVELNIVHNSGKLFLEITDGTGVEYDINERSDGFKYFFSLLIEAATFADKNSDLIFVLDEPGAKLHPSGQKDLLKYLEELSINHRVIYTTHSPFLINRLYPNRVRVIERDNAKGTIFKEKGFSKNWKPMRSALGLTLSDSFYYSEKALLVEGPEDILYLGALINLFNFNKELNISTDVFSFIDAGGEGNLPAMAQIMIDENRPIMVLVDSDSESTYNKIKKKSSSLKSGLLVHSEISDFKKDTVSIEDLLPKKLLINAVNNYIRLLIEDDSIVPIKGKEKELISINSEFSVYKNDIAPFIRENFSNPSKIKEEWNREKVPISKVGIARFFEKELENVNYDDYKVELKYALKLIKEVIKKLKLEI